MENKLDKLFREKLESHSVEPSENAWSKVMAGTAKKNNSIIWVWRAAASIALIGLLGWYLLNGPTDSINKQTAIKTESTRKQEVKKPIEQKPNEIKSVKKEIVQPPKLKKEIAKHDLIAEVKEEQPIEQIALTIMQETDETALALPDNNSNQLPEIEPIPQLKPEKTMVIVYNLASVEPRQVETAKTNGFKRVIEFAKNVKSGESTLASVRDWKDNLLGSEELTRVDKSNNN